MQSQDIKVCLSSRPEQIFENEFGAAARLRLQDLTREDIHTFVSDEILSEMRSSLHIREDERWMMIMGIDTLVDKADGVFLWVSLAIKDQIRGLRNHDNEKQLRERLLILPDKVEDTYARMLGQIDKPYRKEASQSLQLILRNQHVTLLHFILKGCRDLDILLTGHNDLTERRVIEMSRLIRKRIVSTCAGMLEVYEHEDHYMTINDEPQEDEILNLEERFFVSWIHRTALNFMNTSAQGRAFLKVNANAEIFPGLLDFKVLLAQSRL